MKSTKEQDQFFSIFLYNEIPCGIGKESMNLNFKMIDQF